MAVKKVKKKTVKKKSKPQIDLKVRDLDKIKCESKSGCGGFWLFGSALAIAISYVQNTSIWWAILHGILSWFYVIYKIITMYI
jgi:hypothetical protein